jgi:hypothetical protein
LNEFLFYNKSALFRILHSLYVPFHINSLSFLFVVMWERNVKRIRMKNPVGAFAGRSWSVPFAPFPRHFSSLHRAASSSSTPFPLRFTPFHWPAARNVKRETVENERNHIINLLSLHFIYSLITFLFSSLLHRLVSTPYLPHLTRSSLGSYGAEWSVTRR